MRFCAFHCITVSFEWCALNLWLVARDFFLFLLSFFLSFVFTQIRWCVLSCWRKNAFHRIARETRQSRFFQEWTEHVQCGLLKGYCLGYCTHPQYRYFAKVNFNLSKTICQILLFILFVSIQLHSMIIYRIKLIFGLLWLLLCQ